MPKSEAKADSKYNKKAYTQISIVIRRDAKINADFIRDYATSKGESTNGFILRAIKETIEHDNQ